jgi:hypothetical protein
MKMIKMALLGGAAMAVTAASAVAASSAAPAVWTCMPEKYAPVFLFSHTARTNSSSDMAPAHALAACPGLYADNF